jgi:hypothetical protein
MQIWIRRLASVLPLSAATVAHSQRPQLPNRPQHIPVTQTEQDTRQVQRDYLAIPYALPLTVIAEAASKGTLDEEDTKNSLAVAETLDISLTEMKTGAIGEIADQPWAEFATIPDPGQDILYIDAENPNDATPFGTVRAHWGPQERRDVDPAASSRNVQELLEPLNALNNTTFTRYVAYTVKVTYDGRDMKYKALYLFSDEPQKHQVVDLHLTGPRYTDASGAYQPSVLLYSKLRNIPQIHDWVLAHTTTDERCQAQNQLCCLTGHCLYRRSDFDRKFRMPIPAAFNDVLEIPFAPGFGPSSFATANGPINCNPDSPDTCACSPISCIPISPPYSTYPPAQCSVQVKNRQVLVFGLVPTTKYHNWIVTVVHAAGMTNQDEILDGGPSGNCIQGCGELVAAATPPPTGWQTGDTIQGSTWYNSGLSSNACQSVFEIQSFTADFAYGLSYVITGPNSNSYTYSATTSEVSQLGYLQYTKAVGTPSRDSPGWGIFGQ